MVKFALYVRLDAKPGKESELESFLHAGKSIVQQKEPGTFAWFAIKIDNGVFGIFDVFEDEASREAHLNGEVARQLKAKASDLLAKAPEIHKIEVMDAHFSERLAGKKAA